MVFNFSSYPVERMDTNVDPKTSIKSQSSVNSTPVCVLQGVLLLKPSATPEGAIGGQKIVRLWVHEVYRVFYDRLVDEDDRELFFSMVKVSNSSIKVKSWTWKFLLECVPISVGVLHYNPVTL